MLLATCLCFLFWIPLSKSSASLAYRYNTVGNKLVSEVLVVVDVFFNELGCFSLNVGGIMLMLKIDLL